MRALSIALIIVLIILVVWLAAWLFAPASLADRLADKGWVLYSRPGCPFCVRQLQVLGGGYPALVECGSAGPDAFRRKAHCQRLSGFPTWLNRDTGQVVTGFQTESQLEAMAA